MKILTMTLILLISAVLIGCASDISTVAQEQITASTAEEGEVEVVAEPSATLLAGETAKYYDFDKASYEQALADNKNIFLYFYATWCPSCRAEQRFVHGAFDELEDPEVVGFRVNFRDGDTDDFEADLAKEYNVISQSTKILIKDGEVIKKTPQHFTAEEYEGFLEFK